MTDVAPFQTGDIVKLKSDKIEDIPTENLPMLPGYMFNGAVGSHSISSICLVNTRRRFWCCKLDDNAFWYDASWFEFVDNVQFNDENKELDDLFAEIRQGFEVIREG